MAANDRISFDTDTSSQVQSDIGGIIGRLEGLLGERDRQVSTALSDFQMDGASDEYQHVELRWKNASDEVRNIINLVKTTLGENDQTATTTQGKTRTAIANIG
ncbi:pore-forming ESAT-6 family protein [Kocuria sp.]|uniref:pore-forming ESAT-6 family protein n=1 Tax=Kocuria sp. TaxID=1871328 RepID=UPI0026E07C21|nr:pore-forming ESAT-6 family protein [Kocuria sp.]MDO5619561.1 pore-forming ESAT-6 family protein [Kocuria sp.]